jgi:hypothetical protein
MLKQSDITDMQQLKFMGLFVLISQKPKDNIKDYLSTQPAIAMA